MKELDYYTKIGTWNCKGAIAITLAHEKSLKLQKLHELLAKIYQEEPCTQAEDTEHRSSFASTDCALSGNRTAIRTPYTGYHSQNQSQFATHIV